MVTVSPVAPAPSGSCAGACQSWHPLEVIPYFSRWRPGVLRDLVYSFIFNTIIAVAFTALAGLFSERIGLARQFWGFFVFSQFIGYTMHLLVRGLDALVPKERQRTTPLRWARFTVIPIVGVFVGYWLASTALDWQNVRADMFTWRGMLSILTVAAIIAGILLAIFVPRDRAAQAQAQAARDEARANAAEREATFARMQLLEAQVEPHFLYNTLAHVVSLVDPEPALAKRMLHRLIELLRATAASSQRTSTLGSQVELLRAYLELIALRMGTRLAWSIDVAPEILDVAMPPMLLQPVVENAIKHGLEPKVEGGRIDVTAHRDAAALVLAVTDTGLGIAPTRHPDSTGLGLANLRARLAALFGGAATLAIADNSPAGTCVTISLPLAEGW
jgi:signal transduction histidine kinase